MSICSQRETSSRLFHYFAIVGLNPDDGLEPDRLQSEGGLLPPLERSYKAKVLGHYPDLVSGSPFDADGVQMLCLPKGLRLHTQKHVLEPLFHPFLLTKEDGSRNYGYAYIFYEEVNSKHICTTLHSLQSTYLAEVSNSQGRGETTSAVDKRDTRSLPRQFRLSSPKARAAQYFYDITKDQLFVTKGITLVGPHPFLRAAKKFLTKLYRFFTDCDDGNVTLESHVFNLLYEVPVPPPGRCVRFMCVSSEHTCQRPSSNELPLFEYSLREFLELLGAEGAIELISCVLLENQIVLLSSNYYRLMLVAESICILIFPFSWQHVYVPILPASLQHFLDAPVSYIMGLQCEPEERELINIPNEANLCLVDIDRGTVEVPEDLPVFPHKAELQQELSQYVKACNVQTSAKCAILTEQHSQYKYRRRRKPSWSQDSDSGLSSTEDSVSGSMSSIPSLHSPQPQPFSPTSSLNLPGFTQKTTPQNSIYHSKIGNSVSGLSPYVARSGSRCGDPLAVKKEGADSPKKSGAFHFVDLDKQQKDLDFQVKNMSATNFELKWILEELKFNSAVREIFLNRFVHMFYAYENFIVQPVSQEMNMEMWSGSRETLQNFDKTTFLMDQVDCHLPFLSRFTESQLFYTFIDHKMLSWDSDHHVRIFDLKIKLVREQGDDSVNHIPSYEPCSTIPGVNQMLVDRFDRIDYSAPRPQPIDPQMESCTVFNPGHFPLLDRIALNKEPLKAKRRSSKAWHRRDRQAQHLEQVTFSSDQREKMIQEAKSLAPNNNNPELADVSKAHASHINWRFVGQLLKECKTRTKRMLVEKMGVEAIELGHGEGSRFGVEENTLIASLCDLLERAWGHGLQRKQGKSALWSHLLSYHEHQLENGEDPTAFNPNFLSPDLSSVAYQSESAPPSPTRSQAQTNSLRKRSDSEDRRNNAKLSSLERKSPKVADNYICNLKPLPTSLSFDLHNILAITEIKTHIGYARAWIRLSLEKKTLAKHLTTLLSDTELLKMLYKRYAFLRSEDELEQFLSYLLSLTAVDYYCFTNNYVSTVMPYRVIIFPSRKFSAATTSANVWVSIGGTLSHTSDISVPKGHTEIIIQHRNVGLLTTFRIGHDNTGMSPNWMVEHVLVRNEVTGHTWKFPCGRWLGRGIDDGSLERILVGELVSPNMNSEDLLESCRTPPRCRSPSIPLPRKCDLKLSPPQIQQLLGDAVNSLVKYFYKPEKERGSLTLLLCGDLGLVHCLELVFSYGFKSTRFFGRNLYFWDYFERVQENFEVVIREEREREHLSGISNEGRNAILQVKVEFVDLVMKINGSSSQLGKDDKFQLFVCLAARDHMLHRLMLPFQRCPVTSHMYDESAFLRDPQLVKDLINVLSSLAEFQFVLEQSLVRGIDT